MRPTPTAGFVGFLLFGCAAFIGCAADATDEGGGEGADPPARTSRTARDDVDAPPPTFDPDFGPDGGGGSSSPDGGPSSPNPPNGDQCIDPKDPGPTEALFSKLPDTDDCDNAEKPIEGVLNGASDVDMYKVSGADRFGCVIDTKFAIQTAGAEFCVFARCQNATPDSVTGCEKGQPATNDIGWKGCCTAGPGSAVPKLGCGFDGSADFFVRVKPTANACLKYKFTYEF